MITQILLAVDSNPCSLEARKLAFALARGQKASINGVAVVDVPGILRPMPTGIGGSAYQAQADAAQLHRAHAQSQEARAELARAAAEAGIACDISLSEGEPAAALSAAAVAADLIVLGREANFRGEETDGEISEAALAVLAHTARPIVLVPPAPAPDGPLLVAFDGSLPSSRALHLLALLGFAKDKVVEVISINADRTVAEDNVAAAETLLRAHGATRVEPLPRVAASDPAPLIIEQAAASGASMVAMGAYGHNGLKEFFFGSATRQLLNRCPVPIFVYH